ncbi:MAG: type II toxin-antitoxin system HicA family toxin [Chloroflexi bacterium]|nr:type II toxin-antitoxin system HicA family toxin [Chloroflexota bacterium]
MGRLPVVSGKEAVRAFEKAGWEVARRESSHVILAKAGSKVVLSVPDHRVPLTLILSRRGRGDRASTHTVLGCHTFFIFSAGIL